MPESPQLSGDLVKRVQVAALDWFAANQREMPWRRTHDPYLVLLSEVMLQQTQVSRVLPKYLEFVERFPTILHLARAPLAEVIRAWSPLGYNLRAVRLHRAARVIVEHHGEVVPNNPRELHALPGLGEYSAAAVACFAYGLPLAVVDTNVRRVLSRLLPEAAEAGPGALRVVARQLVPLETARDWGLALMDLGATVCTARRPACPVCPLAAMCPSAGAPLSRTKNLAETQHPYTTKPKPFIGSNRYYRGRVVQALRQSRPNEWLGLAELGPKVKPDFSNEDVPWLHALLRELGHEGLVSLKAAPKHSSAKEPGALLASLAGSPEGPNVGRARGSRALQPPLNSGNHDRPKTAPRVAHHGQL